MLVIPYPVIDPVAVQIGPIAIRWYALAYLTGLIGGWLYARWLCRRPPALVTPLHIDDFLTWATLGVVLGGRLGFVLFVRPGYFSTTRWRRSRSGRAGCPSTAAS